MAVNGNFPIQNMPMLPIRQATTQTQLSGTLGIANRTITTARDFLSVTSGGRSVQINPSMMSPGDVAFALSNGGIAATLDRHGRLRLPDAASVSGNATLLTDLGLA